MERVGKFCFRSTSRLNLLMQLLSGLLLLLIDMNLLMPSLAPRRVIALWEVSLDTPALMTFEVPYQTGLSTLLLKIPQRTSHV